MEHSGKRLKMISKELVAKSDPNLNTFTLNVKKNENGNNSRIFGSDGDSSDDSN